VEVPLWVVFDVSLRLFESAVSFFFSPGVSVSGSNSFPSRHASPCLARSRRICPYWFVLSWGALPFFSTRYHPFFVHFPPCRDVRRFAFFLCGVGVFPFQKIFPLNFSSFGMDFPFLVYRGFSFFRSGLPPIFPRIPSPLARM